MQNTSGHSQLAHGMTHVANVQVRDIAGIGQWVGVLESEPIAAEIVRFFGSE